MQSNRVSPCSDRKEPRGIENLAIIASLFCCHIYIRSMRCSRVFMGFSWDAIFVQCAYMKPKDMTNKTKQSN